MALRGGATDATRATLPMIHMRGPAARPGMISCRLPSGLCDDVVTRLRLTTWLGTSFFVVMIFKRDHENSAGLMNCGLIPRI